MKPPAKLYKFHVTNLRAIDAAMKRTALMLRNAIAREDEKTVFAFVRLYALLLATWAECRLRKLLYEPNGFSDQERDNIRACEQQIEQWEAAVQVAFRKHYNIPTASLSVSTLPHSAWSRYGTIAEMLTNDLRPMIQLRNKLAHGQWVYPLNDDGKDIAQAQMDALRVENFLSLQFKKSLLSALSNAIHDLVVSRPTSERDFDRHFRAIVETRRNLQTREYTSYAKVLRDKYERGKTKKLTV